LVPNEGSFPPERLFGERLPMAEIYKYLCSGPLCRYAEDLVTSIKVLSANREIKMKLGRKINFQKLKICYLKQIHSYIVTPVDPEIARALQEAVSYFEQHYNIKAREVKMPWLMDAPRCVINAVLNSVPDLAGMLTGGKGVDFNLKIDFLKSFFGKSTLSFSTLAILNFAHFPLIYRESRNSHYENKVEKIINEFNSLLDEDTVLLMPTMPFSAPYHREGILLVFNSIYTGISNILGLPSTSCPMGFNKNGLPIGIQIVGSKNNDPLTLACAVELEKAFGGWKAPGDEF
ncbi:Fatty-acid amide hydrolase 2-A, partial [Araneus ventricosus]